MSGRNGRRETLSPSLFPFLAVLLCTVGALIVILVLSVFRAKAAARQVVESQQQMLDEEVGTLEVVAGELEGRRQKLQEAIDQQRALLAHFEDHLRRLNEQWESLQKSKQLESQDAQQRLDKITQLQETITATQAEIDKLREQLAEKEKQGKKPPAFAILPYSGRQGTTRRPIYLECTAQGVLLQPEGILLSMEDLAPPHGPGNPLDASLRAIRTEFDRIAQATSDRSSPYPLLLVRPDGVATYALARSAMQGWDDQFGYELVPAAMPLVFPKNPPSIAQRLEATLATARQRHRQAIATMPARYRDGLEELLQQADPREPSNDWGDEALESALASQASGTLPADPNGPGPSQGNWQIIQTANAPSGSIPGGSPFNNSLGGPPNLSLSPQSDGSSLGLPASGDLNLADATSSEPGNPLFFTPSAPGDLVGGSPASGNSTFSTLPGTRNQPPSAPGGFPNAGQAATGTPPFGTGPNDAWGQPNSIGSGRPAGLSGSGGNFGGGLAGNPGTGQSGGSPSPGGSTSDNFSGGSGGPSQSGSANRSGNASGSSSPNPLGLSGSSSPGGSNFNPNDSIDPELARELKEKQPQDAIGYRDRSPVGRSPLVQPPEDDDSQTRPLSITRGRGWAEARAEGKSTPVVREMYLVAHPDRWMLLEESNPKRSERTIELASGPRVAAEQLGDAIRKRVDEWGIAVARGYWKPKLIVLAAPQSDASIRRLERILDGSGVQIEVRPLPPVVPNPPARR
ncbi:MAG: hypothetical protein ACKN81_00970 [Pirellulaceae bacterium]